MYEAATIPVRKRLSTYIPIGEINDPLKDWQNVLNTFILERYKKRADNFSDSKEELSWKTDDCKDVDLRLLEWGIPFDWLDQAFQDLEEIYDECSIENWDGYGARAITQETYFEASKLLELIPTSYPMPDICPEPNGGIGLEWYKERGYSLIVSVSGRNIIIYAGLFGENNEAHGTEHFTNSMPQVILNFLKRLFSDIE